MNIDSHAEALDYLEVQGLPTNKETRKCALNRRST